MDHRTRATLRMAVATSSISSWGRRQRPRVNHMMPGRKHHRPRMVVQYTSEAASLRNPSQAPNLEYTSMSTFSQASSRRSFSLMAPWYSAVVPIWVYMSVLATLRFLGDPPPPSAPGWASERPPVQASAWNAARSFRALIMLSTASQLADFGNITTLRATEQMTPNTMPPMRVAATIAASEVCSAAMTTSTKVMTYSLAL
mmetsp:Transcript_14500/g.43836  ORF Transcript_14500/g.43836 Transcript_14500/m.43836 type:complete len:200 (-) Transcript_14500:705-1304(-)